MHSNPIFSTALAVCAACSVGTAWSQAATATGTFLGEKVNPVMAVELDATPARNLPPGLSTGPVTGSSRESASPAPSASVPMYTGVESSQSLGSQMPSDRSPLPLGERRR